MLDYYIMTKRYGGKSKKNQKGGIFGMTLPSWVRNPFEKKPASNGSPPASTTVQPPPASTTGSPPGSTITGSSITGSSTPGSNGGGKRRKKTRKTKKTRK